MAGTGGDGALYLGVDVGTAGARAGVFDAAGALLGRATAPFDVHTTPEGHVEQVSEEIWRAVSTAVRGAAAEAGARPGAIRALAFDAACSLVVRDAEGRPLSVAADGGPRDTVVWMDHRATAEAERATATGAAPLAILGGTMSPEMQTPKLAWIKRHLPGTWAAMGHAFDLADFLAWRATGRDARSACTLTCKWTYLADRTPAWDADYLGAMDLAGLPARANLPDRALPIGARIGPLTAEAAAELGLGPETVVAAGLIDAHAGALGTLAPFLGAEIDRHLALIAGTSNCHMALAPRPIPVPGVWGPYPDAVAPGTFLAEGGQSAAGALLDHVIAASPAAGEFGDNPHDALADILAARLAEAPDLAPELHVLPDFHGNRSPHADPRALGAITGLDLAGPREALIRLYWAAAAAIAYETREIVEAMNAAGFRIATAHLSGGAARNPVLAGLYAAATGLSVTRPASEDPVLLGAAVAAAAEDHGALAAAAHAMVRPGTEIPADPAAVAVHEARYARYLDFARFQRRFHGTRGG